MGFIIWSSKIFLYQKFQLATTTHQKSCRIKYLTEKKVKAKAEKLKPTKITTIIKGKTKLKIENLVQVFVFQQN